ncbi:hypothetical protein GCM10022248_01700 [Nonomuraea soli]
MVVVVGRIGSKPPSSTIRRSRADQASRLTDVGTPCGGALLVVAWNVTPDRAGGQVSHHAQPLMKRRIMYLRTGGRAASRSGSWLSHSTTGLAGA